MNVGWLSEKEFASILGVGQILPGPNTMNAAVLIGDRFQGVVGVLLCLAGQMALSLVMATTLGGVYERFAAIPEVQATLIGAAASAAGLVLGTAIKMARKLKPTPLALAISILAFAAVGVMQWPLPVVVAVLVPLALAAAAIEGRARCWGSCRRSPASSRSSRSSRSAVRTRFCRKSADR